MRKGLLARSAVAALAFSLMSATGAIAQDKSAGRNPVDKAEKPLLAARLMHCLLPCWHLTQRKSMLQ